jgi:hypothetical protein
MRRSISELLSDAQVARLEKRRKELNLTRDELLQRFDRALRATGCVYDDVGAAKMRLDRVFNSRMRKPISERTKAALAHALDLTLVQFEQTISGKEQTTTIATKALSKIRGHESHALVDEMRTHAAELKSHARRLETLARTLDRKPR